jgi:large subunit ribosomal protein L25
MKTVSISGSPRESVGKKDAKELRKSGLVPCVLYGGKEQVHFSVAEKDFKDLLYSPHVHLADIKVAGKSYQAIVQESQFHAVNDKLLHVDFLEVIDNKPVKIDVPVNLIGTAEGVKAGGKLVKKARTLKVKAFAKDLPDSIDVNVEQLRVGGIIRVKDVEVSNLTLLDAQTNVVATVAGKRGVTDNPAAAAPAKKK